MSFCPCFIVMDLSTECPCGVAVVSAEHALRVGLSFCRMGEQHVMWGHTAPNSGPFLCDARGVTVSSRTRWALCSAQELCRAEPLAGPCCRSSQVTAVPQAGSSCACSPCPGQGAFLTTRSGVRWQYGYMLRAMGAHVTQKQEDLNT